MKAAEIKLSSEEIEELNRIVRAADIRGARATDNKSRTGHQELGHLEERFVKVVSLTRFYIAQNDR